MIMRFGYVSHALDLWDASPAKTLTFTRWKSLSNTERKETLHQLTLKNLQHTIRMLHYNIAHEIHLYRFSSSIVPLATHPEVDWDYLTPFQSYYREIGALVKKHKIRTSFHPNQFTLFTSDKPHITENAVTDLAYHYHLLQAMGIEEEAFINIHVGGAYGDKSSAIARFHKNIKKLPEEIKHRMTLENDDKTYTAEETLEICQKEKLPFMFDYHHYQANKNEDEALSKLLPAIFKTWNHKNIRPKVHLSSPKSDKEYRSHADYVEPAFIMPFLKTVRELNEDFDIMIEAKQKDRAAKKIVEELAKIRGIKRIGEASLEW